jgi:hypothetical protein
MKETKAARNGPAIIANSLQSILSLLPQHHFSHTAKSLAGHHLCCFDDKSRAPELFRTGQGLVKNICCAQGVMLASAVQVADFDFTERTQRFSIQRSGQRNGRQIFQLLLGFRSSYFPEHLRANPLRAVALNTLDPDHLWHVFAIRKMTVSPLTKIPEIAKDQV